MEGETFTPRIAALTGPAAPPAPWTAPQRADRRAPRAAPSDRLPESPAPAASGRRDIALDLIRGLAMVILVVNHLHLESFLETGTRAVLSAAEVLVLVSGVVSGMVFGRRWLTNGARATTVVLLRRARKLYLASVVVVALVGALTLVPGLATDVLAVSPRLPDLDTYAYDSPLRTLLAIVTLEAGPWQFNILGLFIALLAAAPAVLWALSRGWWPAVLAASIGLYVLGRETGIDVLPSQSERAFPLLVWQILFVPGMVLGWHRQDVARLMRRGGGALTGVIVGAGLAAVYLRLGHWGLGPADLEQWEAAHFSKKLLDPARLAAMVSVVAALYLILRRCEPVAERVLGWALLPLGRNSFYVFIMHVFVCLAVASIPVLAGAGIGSAGNAAVQVACLGLLVLMVRRRWLFRWVPR